MVFSVFRFQIRSGMTDEVKNLSEGALIAVATFSNARRWVKEGKEIRSYEWTRYASLPDLRVSGGMGKLLKAFDIDNPVYYADLDWNMVLRLHKQYKPVINDLPKYPEVKRDLALLVDKSVKFADLAAAAIAAEKKLLKQVTLFDVYEGKNLEAGK